MSKRGPLDAFVTRLPQASSKKAKPTAEKVHQEASGNQHDAISIKQLQQADQEPSTAQQQRQQDAMAAAHPEPNAAGTSATPQAVSAGAQAPNHNSLTAASTADTVAEGTGPPAATAATKAAAAPAEGKNAFGALMAGAKGRTPAGNTSNGPKLSAQEVQKQADKNQAAALAAVQAAAALRQPPLLKSLLVEPSWLQVLSPEFDKPYMRELQSFLQQEWGSQVVYPPQECIFRAFNAVPFDQVRVVILGQDPYINTGEAMGLSFSVPPGIRVPPSLVNIYKELAQDVGAQVPRHGCLQKWCSQGVLLLNAALTVRAKASNSHAGKGWEHFTSAALTALAKQRSGIVFLLWGKYAQDRCAKLDMKKHHVLKSVHPSPLSAHRGFLGCRHFSAANKLLVQSGQPPIDWRIEDL